MNAVSLQFGDAERLAAGPLIELALAEDLGADGDLTSRALIDEAEHGSVAVVAREAGVLAGAPVAVAVFERLDRDVVWEPRVQDGEMLSRGTVIAIVSGPVRSLLSGERTVLNFLAHLCGVATLARRYVDAVAGTGSRIFDTRKTLPGYRALDKYAVRAGCGLNHRMGLDDGMLIKDNHLAGWTFHGRSIAAAIERARQQNPSGLPIEVEVDTLEQLRDALAGRPEIVLLDNMDPATLRQAVAIRNSDAPQVALEASGGVTLDTVRAIAATGVERISVGAITHSAIALDIAFDWER